MNYDNFDLIVNNTNKQIKIYKYNKNIEKEDKDLFLDAFKNWEIVSDDIILIVKELMAKYTDNNYARSMLFDDIYQDCCSIFLKYIKPKELLQDRYLMRHLINLALREVIYPHCFVCQGRGTIASGDSIQQCQHCEGSGQFNYNDENRPEFLNMKKKDYMHLKKPYLEMLEFVKNIEINALAKIGDD